MLNLAFKKKTYKYVFTSVFTDSIIDQNGKTWALWHTGDDDSTPVRENKLKYYIFESQPYFKCDCKQVAIKKK
jgi:hypothetical protein